MLGLPVLVFDIETVPDTEAGARLFGLELPPDEVALAMNNLRRQEINSDFPRLPLHEVVCISGLWVTDEQIQLFSFSQQDPKTGQRFSEKEILSKFLGIFDKRFPTLVSWNGSGFDLPVLMLRAMRHGLSAAGLMDQGERDSKRKFDNYQNRYQSRHTDLMDCLAMFNTRNFQRLDDVAVVMGFPGKQGESGYNVSDYVKQDQWTELCQYCESDVLNTWLIYLRWQGLRGYLSVDEQQHWMSQTRDYLQQHAPQQQHFLDAWAI